MQLLSIIVVQASTGLSHEFLLPFAQRKWDWPFTTLGSLVIDDVAGSNAQIHKWVSLLYLSTVSFIWSGEHSRATTLPAQSAPRTPPKARSPTASCHLIGRSLSGFFFSLYHTINCSLNFQFLLGYSLCFPILWVLFSTHSCAISQ